LAKERNDRPDGQSVQKAIDVSVCATATFFENAVHDASDYCGIPLDIWKVALNPDVFERFGPAPHDLIPVDKSGW
jgi:hypothetical protein